jgi:hypothetical protein
MMARHTGPRVSGTYRSDALAKPPASAARFRRPGRDSAHSLNYMSHPDEELSPILGDGPDRSGGGGCGLTIDRLGIDLEPVSEFHTENELWQLVVTVEASPTSLRGFDELEDYGKCRAVRQAALRADRSVPHSGKRTFDGIGGPQMLPMLGREVIEGQ